MGHARRGQSFGGREMGARSWRLVLAGLAVVALAIMATACGEDSNDQAGVADQAEASHGVTAVAAPGCGPVEYGGDGEADLLIASDLPMQGASSARSEQMVDAIRITLERADWRAGDSRVAFQPCDDSLADTGAWDAKTCKANARAYVDDPDLVGVVGTYNSGCAAEMLPIMNRAPVALVSPGNTLVCLTQPAADCADDEPARFAPSGERSYARVVPNDADQAAGLVAFAHDEGVRMPFVLYAADDPTSRGQAVAFRNTAKALDIAPVGFRSWDPEADSYAELMEAVGERNPDAAGPPMAYLHKHGGLESLVIDQGVQMGRPSRLEASMEGDRPRVGGEVVVLSEGTLHL